ncbi:MAG TPA: hypothetical protein VE992_02665 [Solirubrobacteraceae bacterium]|nr:hypothetical protein [Solirubrobacteraceae bacterium]
MTDRWLPEDFEYPARVELASGHHLRPIAGSDVAIDYPAVMGSRERLWAKYGNAWGWPAPTMSYEADRADLERHAREMVARESYNYAILDAGESQLLGCVYLDPPGPGDEDADVLVSWWVVDACVGSELEAELEALLPRWVTEAWPFRRPAFRP